MSTLIAPVLEIDALQPHPNAETLSIWMGPQGPCQVKTADFSPGTKVVFIPADTLVNTRRPEFAFLSKVADGDDGRFPGFARIRVMKLCGEPSIGLVVKAPEAMPVGTDAAEALGLLKWTPPPWMVKTSYPRAKGLREVGIPEDIVYDVENAWRFLNTAENEERRVRQWRFTEKIHGMNFRFVRTEKGISVGSRTRWLRDECRGKPGEFWHEVLESYGAFLEALDPNIIYFGEVYGPTQDLKYGSPTTAQLRIFDAWAVTERRWFTLTEASVPLPYRVPTLFTVWCTLPEAIEQARMLAPGTSTLDEETIREGVVVSPMDPDAHVTLVDTAPDGTVRTKSQRLQFKVISPAYLTRKDGSEVQE